VNAILQNYPLAWVAPRRFLKGKIYLSLILGEWREAEQVKWLIIAQIIQNADALTIEYNKPAYLVLQMERFIESIHL